MIPAPPDDAQPSSDATLVLDAELLASLGIEDMVPAPLAAWRGLIVEAMTFFLQRLPAERLTEIINDQFALPPDAPAAERMVALLARCPMLHKLGQVLARRHELHPELRRQLQMLESMPPSLPVAAIAARIREELGNEAPFTLADAALAEGSVAVVLPFTWRDEEGSHEGVFKVLKPGIEERLAVELALLPELAGFVERRGAELGLPALDYRGTLMGVQRLLEMEVRLDVEQANMRRAEAFYRDDPGVFVPRLLPWCTPRVSAMERVAGTKVSDADLSAPAREALGARMIAVLLAKPFWTRDPEAMFHGDLHGGNLLLTGDGRLAVIDWSLTAVLTKAEREALVAIAIGGLTLDARQIQHALTSLGMRRADHLALTGIIERSLDRLVASGRPVSFAWLVRLLDELALAGATGFGEQLSVFRKTWLALSGVIHDLDVHIATDVPLINVGLRRFLVELPARLMAWPDSRAFGTHVSNADLARLTLAPWPTTMRYWSRFIGGARARIGAARAEAG